MAENTYTANADGTCYVGRFNNTPLTDLIESMPPNSFAQLTTTNIRDAVYNPHFDQSLAALETDPSRPLPNWTNKISHIRSKSRLVWIGTSEGYAANLDGRFRSKAVTYKLAENQFTQNWNPTNRVEGHAYDNNCSIDINGKIYRRSFIGAVVSEYDAETELWSELYTMTGLGTMLQVWAIECFPELGAAGSLLLLEDLGRLVRYDLATSTQTVVGTFAGISSTNVMVYVNGAVIFGGGFSGTTLYRMDSSGNVTTLTNTLPVVITPNGAVNNKMVACPRGTDNAYIFSNTDNLVRKLNTITGTFTTIGPYDSNLSNSTNVAACSIRGTDGIVLLRGRGRSGGVNQSEFWVYKVEA